MIVTPDSYPEAREQSMNPLLRDERGEQRSVENLNDVFSSDK